MKTQLPPFVHAYPAPAVLIGCGTVKKPNLITCSWFGTVCSEPPMISVSVRPSRYSYRLIHDSGEFSVNLAKASQIEAVVHCGMKSGRAADKFKDLNLTPVACPPLTDAPMIDEFFLALACRVKHELALGTHHIFIADVVAVYGEPKTDPQLSRPMIQPEEQLVYLDGKYWSLKPVEFDIASLMDRK
ncbi:MAG: flavin reductase family protein [Calditrichota bacterium]